MKNQLTVHGCCDTVNITMGNTTVMFGRHRFDVNIFYCSNCGSVKATSNIKEQNHDYKSQRVSG